MKRLLFVAVLLIASSLTALGQPRNELSEHQIVDTLQAAGNFKTLLIALDKTGLTDLLNGAGPFTIFAPNDEAFANLPTGVLDALMKDPAKLKALLLYHITAGKFSICDPYLQSGTDKSITMMDNTKAEVQCSSSPANSQSKATIIGPESKATVGATKYEVLINKSARVVVADLSASNGMIHSIDTVLAPGTHWLAQ